MTLFGWPDEQKGEWCRSWRSRWVQSVGGTLWVEEEEEEAGKVEQNLMLLGDGLWFYFVSFTSSLRSAESGTWTSIWKADLGSRSNGHTLWIRWNFLLSDCLHGFRKFSGKAEESPLKYNTSITDSSTLTAISNCIMSAIERNWMLQYEHDRESWGIGDSAIWATTHRRHVWNHIILIRNAECLSRYSSVGKVLQQQAGACVIETSTWSTEWFLTRVRDVYED